jgi:outer membrane immunogenic protein
MYRIFVAATLTASAAVAGTSALAGDPTPPPADPVVVEPGFTWAGPYAGLQLGYLSGHIDVGIPGIDGDPTIGPSPIVERASPDADGFVGGIYGGYNFATSGNLVFGFEGEYNWSHADGSDQLPAIDGLGETLESDIESTAALRGRIGHAMDRTLIYGAAGIAWADLELSDGTATASETMTGWTIGGGVEHAFTDQWLGRIDYRYSSFDDENNFAGTGANVEMETHELRVGVAYKF